MKKGGILVHRPPTDDVAGVPRWRLIQISSSNSNFLLSLVGRGLGSSITLVNFGQLVLICPFCRQLKHLMVLFDLGVRFVVWMVFGRLLVIS